MADLSKTVSRLSDLFCEVATSDKGIHAESAVAAAATMAGTFLFRSFGLPIDTISPGAPVLSDKANELGPHLIEIFGATLTRLDVSIDWRYVTDPIDPLHAPLLSLLEMQERLAAPLLEQASRAKFSDYDMAMACAASAAQLVRDVATVLDTAVGIGLVGRGFVEGAKTAPTFALRVPLKKKSWFGF